MGARSSGGVPSLVLNHDEALIGLWLEQNGTEVIHYFDGEAQADEALSEDDTRLAFEAIGAFNDLDLDDMLDALDRIRHDSAPTPPIEL
jgi:hypothetical protein